MEKKLWFRRKRYGFGWYPSTWEGWVVIFIWVIFFASFMAKMDHEWLKNLLFIFVSVSLLIYICYRKGESPRWQWGGKDNKDQK